MSHKGGAIDDSAAELAMAAGKIDAPPRRRPLWPVPVRTLGAVCQAAAGIYPQVWKFDMPRSPIPTREAIRNLLVKVVPAGAVVLLPHDHFGMDLGPGLAVKLDAAYVPDVVGIESAGGAA
jgi:electron transfer flavoprotein alpha subunit